MPNYKFTKHTKQAIVQTEGSRNFVCKTHGISRTWDYEIRKRISNGEDLDNKSCRPKNTRIKSMPPELTKKFMEDFKKRHNKCGYQKFHLQLMHDYPEWKHITERDVRKAYEKYDLMKRKKPEKVIRYEKETPGELTHTDYKYCPVVEGKKTYFQELMDDCTRTTTAAFHFNKTALGASKGLEKNIENLNIVIDKMLADNGAEISYRNLPANRKPKDKIHPVDELCRKLSIKQIYTKPMRPQTNGKSERLHKSLDDEVFSQQHFDSIETMIVSIEKWLKYYNEERVHMGIRMTPLEKMKQLNPDYVPPKSYLTVIR